MDKNVFPKGTYVVLLSSCDGKNNWASQLPEGYIYKLREDSTSFNFMVDKDINGSRENGWGTKKEGYKSELLLRAATQDEIDAYEQGIMRVADVKPSIYQIY